MTTHPPRLLVVHGPNLNLLGSREPEFYGSGTLAELDASLAQLAQQLGAEVECRQSNHEGQIVDWLQEAVGERDGVLINPAAYTHTSVAIADALRAIPLPCVEVHLSQVHAREGFRARSLTAAACVGVIAGFGHASYALGLRALFDYLRVPPKA